MKKILFSSLVVGVMLITSCKKELVQGTEETTQLSLGNEVQPTAVLSPTIFFVDKNILWSITNIAAANPTVTKKGIINNIETFCGDMKCNQFNSDVSTQEPIYNPYTDQILSTHGNEFLEKCFTPTQNNTKILVPGIISNKATGAINPIGINPVDKKLYYYGQNNTDPIKKFMGNINMDGTNNVIIRQFDNTQVSPNSDLNSCAIDFEKKILYMPHLDGLYTTPLDKSENSKIFVPAIFGETMDFSEVKVDKLHKTVFFSTVIKAKKLRRVYRIDASGDFNTLKKIVEVKYFEENQNQFNLYNDSFTFDISPETNTVFFCQRAPSQFPPFISTISRVNMDGTNLKLLHRGIYINTIVAATPVSINK